MELGPYIDELTRALAIAGEAGGAEVQAVLDRFTAPLESAIRLAMLNVLSGAADEISTDLAPGSVDVRLRSGNPEFVVRPALVDETPVQQPTTPVFTAADEEGATARISLRVPERLKAKVDEAAGREGLSANAWLVRVVAAAVDGTDQATMPRPNHGRRYVGWIS
ncbi:MAG TPA: hypothetical protein VGM75_37485 [Pseudonocardiaceae bacterium]